MGCCTCTPSSAPPFLERRLRLSSSPSVHTSVIANFRVRAKRPRGTKKQRRRRRRSGPRSRRLPSSRCAAAAVFPRALRARVPKFNNDDKIASARPTGRRVFVFFCVVSRASWKGRDEMERRKRGGRGARRAALCSPLVQYTIQAEEGIASLTVLSMRCSIIFSAVHMHTCHSMLCSYCAQDRSDGRGGCL